MFLVLDQRDYISLYIAPSFSSNVELHEGMFIQLDHQIAAHITISSKRLLDTCTLNEEVGIFHYLSVRYRSDCGVAFPMYLPTDPDNHRWGILRQV